MDYDIYVHVVRTGIFIVGIETDVRECRVSKPYQLLLEIAEIDGIHDMHGGTGRIKLPDTVVDGVDAPVFVLLQPRHSSGRLQDRVVTCYRPLP